MPSTQKRLSKMEFSELVRPMIGSRISQVWRGCGSAIFLEFGELREERYPTKNGRRKTLVGQFTISIEWSWRVERARSIAFGSWSTDRIITKRLQTLLGRSIESLTLFGRVPELQLALSDGLWLTSYMTSHGQPEWAVHLPNGIISARNASTISFTES